MAATWRILVAFSGGGHAVTIFVCQNVHFFAAEPKELGSLAVPERLLGVWQEELCPCQVLDEAL